MTAAAAYPALGHCEFEESPVSNNSQLTITTLRGKLTVTTTGRLNRISAPLSLSTQLFLEHGWQSWSAVRLATPSDFRPERATAPRWFRSQMLADRDGAGRELSGDSYLIFDGGAIGALSNRRQFTRVVVANDGTLRIEWLFDDIEVEAGQVIELEPHVIVQGDPGLAYSTYVSLAAPPSLRTFPTITAWCSWYHYFGGITPDVIRENLALAAQHGIDVVQIDDGWQREIGVWTDVAPSWGEPISQLAREISNAGCTPGIWTAPFLAIDGGTIHREHPDWLVANERGEPTTALHHGGWGGKIFALDLTHPDVLAHLELTYRHLRQQGFTYFKIDFLHAGAAVGLRHRPDQTRAEAFVQGMEAVRRGIGDEATLVGCGSPLLAAVGLVDIMRVSEDVAPFFLPRQYFEGFPENTVAGQNALEASLLRAPLHERWFTLDPDCILLRTSETELTDTERLVVARGAALASSFLVVSDRLELYSDREWELAASLWEETARGPRELPRPLQRPLRVESATQAGTIDIWSDPPSITLDRNGN